MHVNFKDFQPYCNSQPNMLVLHLMLSGMCYLMGVQLCNINTLVIEIYFTFTLHMICGDYACISYVNTASCFYQISEEWRCSLAYISSLYRTMLTY